MLAAGQRSREVSAAPSVQSAISDLAKMKDMNTAVRPKKAREIPSLPPGAKPVTQAHRDRKAREAAGL